MSLFSANFLFLSFILFAPPTTYAVTCGSIKEMTGRVEILRIVKGEEALANPARNAVVANTNFELDCTDIVVTTKGARAVLKFNTASISMSSNSRISVMQYSKKTGDADMLNLTYGRLRVFFDGKNKDAKANEKTELKDDIKFRVKTPTAVAGVRGTDFYTSFDPEPHITEQATITGKVEVTQRGSNQKVMVDAGKQVEVPSVKGTEVLPEVQVEKAMAVEEVKPQEIAKRLELNVEPIKSDEKAKAEIKLGEQAETVKPLEVKNIEAETVKVIRDTSSIAKNEKVFSSAEAVKILGKPETWVPLKEGLPEEFKGIKNEF